MSFCQRHIPAFLLGLLCFFCSFSYGQESVATSDSLNLILSDSLHLMPADSISTDSISTDSIPPKKEKLEAPVIYSANDSVVMNAKGEVFMFGEGKVDYGTMTLTADYITFNADSSLVTAIGRMNEEDELIGSPVLTDNGQEYQSKSIQYNFQTKKGYILQGIIQEGDGYIIGTKTKKVDEDIFFMTHGKYTTCDHHDHPHFYLDLSKAKVKQNSWVVTGPAYLVLLDIPTPFAIPFGYFPMSKTYSSGVIIPSYGDDLTRGFFLTNGGYYFAINDYMDLTAVGDIYTMGTWAVNLTSTYVKKYKFRGNANFSYRKDIVGEKELPGYMEGKNLSVLWTHTQDPKASPNSTFSASVNFSSSGYDRSNIDNYYNYATLSQNIKSSSISYSYRLPNTAWSFSVNTLASQRTADSTISLTLPDLSINMSRIYPLKRKNPVGKERWYEKLYLSYSGKATSRIDCKEYDLLNSSFVNDWQKGIDHSIPLGLSLNLLQYLSITPTATYHERWYFNSVEQSWDAMNEEVLRDTINGFNRVYDFNTGVSLSTKIYGFFTPSRRIFGDKIDRIRHVITPTLSYSFRPDFGEARWGYYTTYARPISKTDPTLTNVRYSLYEGAQFGVPGSGKSSALSFSINNNIEMKVKQKNDTIPEGSFKNISLIDAFGVSGSYNFAADSLNWSDFTANLRLKFTESFGLSLSAGFDTYLYGLNEFGNPTHIDTPRWEVGKMPRLIGTSTSFGYTISNDTFKKKSKDKEEQTSEEETDPKAKGKKKDKEKDKSQNQSIPFTLGFDYSIQYGYSDFNYEKMEYNHAISQNATIRASINPTPGWSFNFSAAFNLDTKELTYSSLGIRRSLHCWSMTANVVPFGLYKSYNFLISVDSSLLSDIKYEKRNDYGKIINWY